MEEASCSTVKEWEPTSVSEYEVFDLTHKKFKEVKVREASNVKTSGQLLLQEVRNDITSDSNFKRQSPVPAASQKTETTTEHQDILELLKELEEVCYCEDSLEAGVIEKVRNDITSDCGIERKSLVPAVSQKAEATTEHQEILDWQYDELLKVRVEYPCEEPSDASFKAVEVREASDFKTAGQLLLQEVLNDSTSDSGMERKSPEPAEATIEHQNILDWQYTAELIKELEKYLCEDPSDASFKAVEVREASDFKAAGQLLLQEVLNDITSDSGIERKSPVPAVFQKAEAPIEHQDILDWQYTAELMKELEKYLCEDPSDARFRKVEVGEASHFKTAGHLLLQEVGNNMTSPSDKERKSPVPAVKYPKIKMEEASCFTDQGMGADQLKEVEVRELSDFKTAGQPLLQEVRNDITSDLVLRGTNQPTYQK